MSVFRRQRTTEHDCGARVMFVSVITRSEILDAVGMRAVIIRRAVGYAGWADV